jgi:hypothetical protein
MEVGVGVCVWAYSRFCCPVSHQVYGIYKCQRREGGHFPRELDVLMDTVRVVEEVSSDCLVDVAI